VFLCIRLRAAVRVRVRARTAMILFIGCLASLVCSLALTFICFAVNVTLLRFLRSSDDGHYAVVSTNSSIRCLTIGNLEIDNFEHFPFLFIISAIYRRIILYTISIFFY
jgi:hypothetical protein